MHAQEPQSGEGGYHLLFLLPQMVCCGDSYVERACSVGSKVLRAVFRLVCPETTLPPLLRFVAFVITA